MNHYVSHLEGAIDGTVLPFGQLANMHNGRPIWVRYHLDKIQAAVTPADIAKRPPSLWRYRELLPLPRNEEPVTLGEGMTPLLHCARLGNQLGLSQLYVKDESQLPTGSFKSRGMAAAVSMAKWLGVKRVALPTAGNAGGAAAAYAARAGIECFVFMPHDTPIVNQFEVELYGAKAFRVNGLINDCGKIVKDGAERMGWFDLSTLKEPYRIEGKKTMGLELADQLGWTLPDVIFYPTGGGTGFIGMWKAFAELEALGWIGPKRPRMVAVQTTGCCPIVRAHELGHKEVEIPWADIRTNVHGVRVAKALGDFLILRVLYESNGFGSAVNDEEVEATRKSVAEADGTLLSPEGAACVAAYGRELARGRVSPSENAVIFNTATGLRTPMPLVDRKLDITQPIDFSKL